MSSNYLNYHFSGTIVETTQLRIEDSYLATRELTDYLYNLTIDNSVEKECENIGKWIGYPRPYIPNELLIDNAFLFFKILDLPELPPYPLDFPFDFSQWIESVLHGFSSLAHPLTGGRLISLVENASKLPLDIYKALLKVLAIIKWSGWTLYTLDKMLFIAGINYVITWDSLNDIVVTFDEVINPVYTYIFETLIAKFSTLPRITLTT
jgi:hypothetical protein